MILDRIENAKWYFRLHPRVAVAFEYLAQHDLAGLADGRYEIDGPRVYLLMAHSPGRGREGATLEAHRKYVDIQIPLSAAEEMGWRDVASCRLITQPYDAKADIEFFTDPPQSWITVSPGSFVLFLPHDAHAPLACDELIHKAVFKLAID